MGERGEKRGQISASEAVSWGGGKGGGLRLPLGSLRSPIFFFFFANADFFSFFPQCGAWSQARKITVEPLYNSHLSLGTEKSGHCRKVAVVERLKQELMYGLSAKKKMSVVERWPLVEVRLYRHFVPSRAYLNRVKLYTMATRVLRENGKPCVG